MKYTPLKAGFFLLLSLSASASTLSTHDYLTQVRENHTGLKASLMSSQGALERSVESDLITAPFFFLMSQDQIDKALAANSIVGYDRLDTLVTTVGAQQQTNFGLRAQLSYQIVKFKMFNPQLPPIPGLAGSSAFMTEGYSTLPKLELTQSLWGNGFGRGTQATQTMAEAQALAAHYGTRFQARASLIEAEMAYWRLAL